MAHLIFWHKKNVFLQLKKVGQTKKTASWKNYLIGFIFLSWNSHDETIK